MSLLALCAYPRRADKGLVGVFPSHGGRGEAFMRLGRGKLQCGAFISRRRVCVCVCMYICMYECMYHTYAWVSMCVYVCMMYACVCVCV
jgi:hypothetical protein